MKAKQSVAYRQCERSDTKNSIRLPSDGPELRMQHNTPLSIGFESGVADEHVCCCNYVLCVSRFEQ